MKPHENTRLQPRKSSQSHAKLALLHLRVIRSDQLPAEVPGIGRRARRLVLGDLAEAHVEQDLSPSGGQHLGDGPQAVGHVRELQARAGGEVTGELAGELRGDVAL